jgi:hypothetical protein
MPYLLAAHAVFLVREREHKEGGGADVGFGAELDIEPSLADEELDVDETEWGGQFAGCHHVFARTEHEVVCEAYHVGARPDGMVSGAVQGEGLVDGLD